MNKRQIEFAARLYELANTACLDTGGCESEEEVAVVARAIERCYAKLERMGYNPHELKSLQGCIDAAKCATKTADAQHTEN